MSAETDAALINAGTSITTTGMNAIAQGNINRKTRKYNEQMYDKQKQDALANWNMQNEYNSPAAQMKRLREAGLNPNMVYGHGQAVNTASTPQTPSPQSWNPKAADYSGMAESVGRYYNTKMQQINLSNAQKQGQVLDQEKIQKAAQTAQIVSSTAMSEFNRNLQSDLRQNSLDFAVANLNKVKAETAMTSHEDDRKGLMNKATIEEIAQRVRNMRVDNAKSQAEKERIVVETANALKTGVLQDLDIALQKRGIQRNDPMYFRWIARYLDTDDGQQALKRVAPSKDIAPKGNIERWLDRVFK